MGYVGVLSPLTEPLWVRAVASLPACVPNLPPLKKMQIQMQTKTTTPPVTVTEFVRSLLEDVIGQKQSVIRKDSVIPKKKREAGRLRSNRLLTSATALPTGGLEKLTTCC